MDEWKSVTLGQVASFVNGFAFGPAHWGTEGLPIIRIEQMLDPDADVDRFGGPVPDRFRLSSGDLLMSWSGTIEIVRWSRGPALVNQHLFRVEPLNNMDPAFLFHLLKASLVALAASSHGTTMKHIKRSDLLSFQVTLPPLAEQRSIAEVLGTLDERIASAERMIAKLKALRTGLAKRLFDNLDSAPYRSLEEVCIYFDDGDWIETPFISDSGVRLIQTGNIGRGEYLDKPANARFVSEVTFRQLRCKRVLAGDLLFCRLADPVARACQVPTVVGPAITSVDCSIVRVDERVVDPRFLLHWASGDEWLNAAERLAGGSTRKRISRSNLGSLRLPCPAIEVQQEISATIDATLDEAQQALAGLSKLHSLRLGLADDLLTGRVRTVGL